VYFAIFSRTTNEDILHQLCTQMCRNSPIIVLTIATCFVTDQSDSIAVRYSNIGNHTNVYSKRLIQQLPLKFLTRIHWEY